MGKSRGQGQARGQARSRSRNRPISASMRIGLADLEVAWGPDVLPGPCPASSELGFDEEMDGDLLMEEEEEGESLLLAPDESEDDGADGLSLAELLGSRPPVVLVRLVLDGERICARTEFEPPTEEAAESLRELRAFLAHLFQRGREALDAAEWAKLVGSTPAPLAERLLLLSRLAVGGSTAVAFHYAERHSDDPVARWTESWVEADTADPCRFTPHDRGHERYANKFAALPDGTPFSIRLLLLDARGRPDPHPFKHLPMAVKLQALRSILAEEEKLGQTYDYERFREEFQQALDRLGVAVDRPTWNHIKNLFETLARSGLGDLFPDKEERQRRYDARRQSGEEAAR
jgi:hypothetical protein